MGRAPRAANRESRPQQGVASERAARGQACTGEQKRLAQAEKAQLQAARAAAKQRRDQLKAEIMSAAQDVAREERVAARLEAERLKAEAKAASVHAKEDARAAAKFERSKPSRPTSKRKTLGTGKRKLISYADLLRMRW